MSLIFGDDGIAGEGTDPYGAFTVRGTRHPGECALRFVKRHASGHEVAYRGILLGDAIAGAWEHASGHCGEFRLRPVRS